MVGHAICGGWLRSIEPEYCANTRVERWIELDGVNHAVAPVVGGNLERQPIRRSGGLCSRGNPVVWRATEGLTWTADTLPAPLEGVLSDVASGGAMAGPTMVAVGGLFVAPLEGAQLISRGLESTVAGLAWGGPGNGRWVALSGATGIATAP